MTKLRVLAEQATQVLGELLTWPASDFHTATEPALEFVCSCLESASANLVYYEAEWQLLHSQPASTLEQKGRYLTVVTFDLYVTTDQIAGPLKSHLCELLPRMRHRDRRALARALRQAREVLKQSWDQHEKWKRLTQRSLELGDGAPP